MKRNGATITETRSEVYLVRSRGPRRHTSRPILAAAVAVFAMGIAVAPGYATEGAYLTGLDALHLQRAGGGAASPRSAAWMVVNPAGLTTLESGADMSLLTVRGRTNVTMRGVSSNWVAGHLESDVLAFVPSGGVVWRDDRNAWALGFYVPAASATDYPDSRNLFSELFFGNRDRRLTYQHLRLVGAYARAFDNGWSVGLGLHGSVSRLRTDHLTLNLTPTAGDNAWDETPGFGFGLGVLKEWDRFAFGVGYVSRHWVGDLDTYEDLVPYNVELPQTVQAGVAWRVTPRFEVTADYKWIDWTDTRIFGTSVHRNSLDWADQHIVKLGLEWRALERVAFRAGWSHGNTPIDRDHAFVSALTPATFEDQIAFGVSWNVADGQSLHVTALYAFPHTVRDSGTGDFSRTSPKIGVRW
ncbi:MAG TPA: outer membrane protein transport protein, partial [Candidatus Hydrogenedentes bacterium]|nr:outer membrane protein transport protein [Candidatus Hydrogenedentota bacterium]